MRATIISVLSLGVAFWGACATEKRETSSNANLRNVTAVNANLSTTNDVPAEVRAALAGAQTVVAKRKELSAAQVAEVERESGAKLESAAHTTYLGYALSGGVRKQVGAATVLEVEGKRLVVVYESRNGLPYIKEVRAADLPLAFLTQFQGKGHDDPLQLGRDVQAHGVDERLARAITDAIRRDTLIMQALYGAPHTH
jgi:hypothetical protein